MKRIFPFLNWITKYKKNDFLGDLSAGLTVGIMLIPQGMAYAMLAGLPPIYGLYTATIPLILYAIFGTSRQLAVGPTAVMSLLVASEIGLMAQQGTSHYIELAILLAMIVGFLQLLMGFLRLGFLINFLSHPVISGFTSAAAIIIGFSQLKHLLGIHIPRGNIYETIHNIIVHSDEINIYTFGIGVVSIVVIILMKRINKKLPSPLVVIVLSTLVVYFFGLDKMDVMIVREVPPGLPTFALPFIDWKVIVDLLPIAITISLIGFTESIAVAKAVQGKHKEYDIVPNQELIALGIANIGGSLFHAFPTTGGFSRTAVNEQAGAKTGIASVISALVVLFTLLFLTEYFYYLPTTILAAIIMVAVYRLIDFKEAISLWKADKSDFAMFIITVLATVFIGIEEGIIVGFLVSMIYVIYQISYPHVVELGKEPQTQEYRNIERFDDLNVDDTILIIRIDAQLFFANLNHFQDKLKQFEERKPNLKVVIIDARAINSMDSSTLHFLNDLIHDYETRGIRLCFAGIKGSVRDLFQKMDLVKKVGKENFFISIDHAIEHINGNNLNRYPSITFQSNI
jgi:SulP family sulfate permease